MRLIQTEVRRDRCLPGFALALLKNLISNIQVGAIPLKNKQQIGSFNSRIFQGAKNFGRIAVYLL